MKRTYSKDMPQLKRLHNKIIYPVDVQEIEVKTEEGNIETHYSYYKVELIDYGDDINNKTEFAKQRYAELRRKPPIPHGYGSKEEQMEMQQEQGFSAWQDHCQQVKNNWPKD